MNLTNKPNYPKSRLVNQEKNNEKEAWHKLVVKVISWKDGLTNGGFVTYSNKITTKEWNIYSKKIAKTNLTNGKQKVHIYLKETKELIKKYGGFEDNTRI